MVAPLLPTLLSYRTMNEQGNIVEQTKAEVVRICDTFNIQVDNPVVILTQDTAKTFLTSSNDNAMYKVPNQAPKRFAIRCIRLPCLIFLSPRLFFVLSVFILPLPGSFHILSLDLEVPTSSP